MHRRAQTTHIASWIVCSALRWGLLWHDSRLPTAKGNEYKDTSTAPSNQMLLLLLCVFFLFLISSSYHISSPLAVSTTSLAAIHITVEAIVHILSLLVCCCVVWMGFFCVSFCWCRPHWQLATHITHARQRQQMPRLRRTTFLFHFLLLLLLVAHNIVVLG